MSYTLLFLGWIGLFLGSIVSTPFVLNLLSCSRIVTMSLLSSWTRRVFEAGRPATHVVRRVHGASYHHGLDRLRYGATSVNLNEFIYL